MARITGIKWDLLDPAGNTQRIRFSSRKARDDAASLNRFLRRFSKKRNTGAIRKGSGGGFDPASRRQFCMAKMTYSKKMSSHKKFLRVYMPQKNKEAVTEKPRLFGSPDYEEHMVGKHSKFIISPDSQAVDTELLTTLLVKRMENESGYEFYWRAVEHRDTAHKHAHLLINGVDRKGNDIWFKPDFVRNRVREMCQDICTGMIGERTSEQKKAYTERNLEARRFTKWDEAIASRAIPNYIAASKEQWPESVFYGSETERKRLGELEKIGVARFAGENKYLLEKDWKGTLKAVGRYNTFLTEKQKNRNLRLWSAADGKIEGRVTYIYSMNDKDVWNNAVVVENRKTKETWYVPLYKAARRELYGKEVRVESGVNAKGKAAVKISVPDAGKVSARQPDEREQDNRNDRKEHYER